MPTGRKFRPKTVGLTVAQYSSSLIFEEAPSSIADFAVEHRPIIMSLPSLSGNAVSQGSITPDRPQSTPSLRKSCHFCRSRKIRCSGQSICGACRERNIDCSYEREGAKGRPKLLTSKSSSSRVPLHKSEDGKSASISPSRNATAVASGSSIRIDHQLLPCSNDVPRSDLGLSDGQDSRSDNSIAAELQDTFNRYFVTHEIGGIHAFDDALVSLHRKNTKQQEPPKKPENFLSSPMTYEGLFFILAPELVEMLALQFGDLGCHQLESGRSQYLSTCLSHDTSDAMFDFIVDGTNPLLSYENHRTTQMIEIWFSQHPFAFIISKTLLLRSLRNNTHDEILIAIILADVKCAQEDEKARLMGDELFKWASFQLRNISKEGVALSTIQAIILLGWHELCIFRARRAMCYFGLAGSLIPCLQSPILGVNQINGIDVGEVELELKCNVHWLIFSITLWALMQIDSPISEQFPSNAPTNFPPVDESASAVFKLDMMSDNLSTLPNQARMFRELWPLSHIASTTAHIYALYPQKQDADGSSSSSCWQSRALHQLRHLSSLRQDISVLCTNIRSVLVNAIELVEAHVENRLSQALVLSAYHTMIIHFLFPRMEGSSGPVPLTNKLIDDFYTSAGALLKVLSVLDTNPDSGRVIMGLRPSSNADVFALGLDACGRAISCFYSRYDVGSEPEKRHIMDRRVELSQLTSELHKFSKHLMLLPTTRSRTVKKQLKFAMRSLAGLHLERSSFGFQNNRINMGSDPFEVANSSNSSLFSPYLPTTPDDHFRDARIFPFFETDGNGLQYFDSNANISKPARQHSFPPITGREDGHFEGNAFFDEMHIDSTSSDSSHFDLGLGVLPIEYGSAGDGNRENAELRGWIDSLSNVIP